MDPGEKFSMKEKGHPALGWPLEMNEIHETITKTHPCRPRRSR
jgi:hypothetical protein